MDATTDSSAASTVTRNYRYMCCAALGLGLGATKEHSLQRSVTEEQQRPRPNAAQPTGRPFFFALTALLAPRSEEHTSELQSRLHLVCRLLLEKKKKKKVNDSTYIEQ